MKFLLSLILASSIALAGISQTDTILEKDIAYIDSVLWAEIKKIEWEEDELEVLEDITFENNITCFSKDIKILKADVIHCHDIRDKSVLPSRYHINYLRSRILNFYRKNDTLIISLIGHAGCCSNFLVEILCECDTVYNIIYNNIGYDECFCGVCPNIFTFTILDKNYHIQDILLNGKKIHETPTIYANVIEVESKNFFTGKKIVRTYNERVWEPNLILEQTYTRRGELIDEKLFYQGKEIHE